MADREEWEDATAHSRHLAIAADAELRRRHPEQKIAPLSSAEPAPVNDTHRKQLASASDSGLTETAAWIHGLTMQRERSRAEMDERPRPPVPSEDLVRGDLGQAFPGWPASGRGAILQPPKPEIIPSDRIFQLAADQDTEFDHEAAD